MKPHNQQLRLEAIRLHQQDISIREISRRLGVSTTTISTWVKLYKTYGEKGLKPNYSSNGRSPSFPQAIIKKAIEYKSKHPQWGAPFILIKLEDDFPNEKLPSARWLQKIFHKKELQPKRTILPKGNAGWVSTVFARVQVDAKERLKTADGQNCCYLNFTDEYTGSELDAFLFPLRSNL